MRERDFGSIEEMNAFVQEHMRARNARPLPEFEGLSPDQMHRLLHFAFASPEVLRFDYSLEDEDRVPLLDLWVRLAEAVGEKGVRATQSGNLPRELCREVMRAHLGDEGYARLVEYGEPRSESDLREIHTVRLSAEMGGLLRKAGGRFRLTRRQLDAMKRPEGRSRMLEALFGAYTRKLSWAYLDRFPELGIVQQSFPFSLYLLQRMDAAGEPAGALGARFLRAFPAAVAEVANYPFSTPEKLVADTFVFRALRGFASSFGLVEPWAGKLADDIDAWVVRPTALARRVARFGAGTVDARG